MPVRLIVHKEVEGVNRVTIVPGRGMHLAPIEVQGRDRRAVMDEVGEIMAKMPLHPSEPAGKPE